jgi:hypothetical protein
MSRTIRVDDEVFKTLQQRGQAFVDTPNDVLRRLLGLNHSRRRAVPRSRMRKGAATPQGTYRPLILQGLAKTGGRAGVHEVLAYLKQQLNGRFTAADLEHLTTGAIRWENKAEWERHLMVREGLLKPDSPRGIWELSDKGWREARRNEPVL